MRDILQKRKLKILTIFSAFTVCLFLSFTAQAQQVAAPGCDNTGPNGGMWGVMERAGSVRRVQGTVTQQGTTRQSGSVLAATCFDDAMALVSRLGSIFSDAVDMGNELMEIIQGPFARDLFNDFGAAVTGLAGSGGGLYSATSSTNAGGSVSLLGAVDTVVGSGVLQSYFGANFNFSSVGDILSDLGGQIQNLLADALNTLTGLVGSIVGTINGLIDSLSGFVNDVGGAVLGTLSAITNTLDQVSNVLSTITDVMGTAGSLLGISDDLADITNFATDFNTFLNDTSGFLQNVSGTFEGGLQVVNGLLDTAGSLVDEFAKDLVDMMTGIFGQIEASVSGINFAALDLSIEIPSFQIPSLPVLNLSLPNINLPSLPDIPGLISRFEGALEIPGSCSMLSDMWGGANLFDAVGEVASYAGAGFSAADIEFSFPGGLPGGLQDFDIGGVTADVGGFIRGVEGAGFLTDMPVLNFADYLGAAGNLTALVNAHGQIPDNLQADLMNMLTNLDSGPVGTLIQDVSDDFNNLMGSITSPTALPTWTPTAINALDATGVTRNIPVSGASEDLANIIAAMQGL